MTGHGCPLCAAADEQVLWQDGRLRVIHVDDPCHPGFTRVIWNRHTTEMTQLAPGERAALMEAIWQVEQTLRDVLSPTKINLAQFGNMVPHLHWHVIPRWRDDSHFPEAIWASAPERTEAQARAWQDQQPRIVAKLPAYHVQLAERLTVSAASWPS